MEQRLGKRVVMSEDRISELHEALLTQILSLLPTKEVIATSVLSKRWRSLWKIVPKLSFVSYNQKFAENVGRSLLSHKAPVLESLHLMVRVTRDDPYIGDIAAWAGIAFARHVREFVLDVEVYFRFPSCLFCCDTLQTLKLKNLIHIDLPSPVSMRSLRTLHLESVTYKDDESIRNLLSGCPNLESLLVHRGYPNDVENFMIVVPSLQRLLITDETTGRSGGYVINAPSLKYLKIENLKGYERCVIENATELVEANISNVSDLANEKIMGSLKSVKRLFLDISPLEIKCPSGSIFYRLVYLEMHTYRREWWNLLAYMLDSSPKLQVLKIIDCWPGVKHRLCGRNSCLVGEKWSEPKYVPQCLLSHLETFVWTRYDWRREEEREVANYILQNAIHLKKTNFSIRLVEQFIESEDRLEMLKQVNRIARASNSCPLVFEFD